MKKTGQTTAAQKPAPQPLAPLNAALESAGALPDVSTVFLQWIWKSDPDEPFEPGILLNRSHLLGLLACRHTAAARAGAREPTPTCDDARMHLVQKAPSQMTLRELRDTLDNLLIEFPRFVERLKDNPRARENVRAVASLVEACFARLGHLAQWPHDATVFDDASCTEPHAGGLMRLSRPGLRRLLGSFLVVFRHLDLLKRCKPPPPPQDATAVGECSLRKHHMEASTDDFHMLCMHMLLPVAAKLNYKQDFPGMYNHVSQVIYFHNTQYERTVRAELGEILARGEPMQAIPAICQIHPEIELAYEEDCLDLSGPTGKWRWLVLPRRVYLVDPESNVYHSENALELLNAYKAISKSTTNTRLH